MHVLKGAARRLFFAAALVTIALPLASGGLMSAASQLAATPASAQATNT